MVPEANTLIQSWSAALLPLHDMHVHAVGFLVHSSLAPSVCMTRCPEPWKGSPWRGTTQGPKSKCWCTFLMACHSGGSQQRSDLGLRRIAAGLATMAAVAGHGSACTIQLTSTALCTAGVWMTARHAMHMDESVRGSLECKFTKTASSADMKCHAAGHVVAQNQSWCTWRAHAVGHNWLHMSHKQQKLSCHVNCMVAKRIESGWSGGFRQDPRQTATAHCMTKQGDDSIVESAQKKPLQHDQQLVAGCDHADMCST